MEVLTGRLNLQSAQSTQVRASIVPKRLQILLLFSAPRSTCQPFFWLFRHHDPQVVTVAILILSGDIESDQYFVKPVSSRWLSLGVVCERLIEQYTAMTTYFLKTFPG